MLPTLSVYELPESLRQVQSSAIDCAPGRLRRCRAFAYELGRAGVRRQFASDLINDALDGDPKWWGNDKAGAIRASVVAQAACDAAYLAGGTERARAALAREAPILATAAGEPLDEWDFQRLAEIAAAEASLSPEIVVDLVAEYVPLRRCAPKLAETAVAERDWQVIVPDKVIEAQRAVEPVDAAEQRERAITKARRNAAAFLSSYTSIADLAGQISEDFPLIGSTKARIIADEIIESSARSPQLVRGPHPIELFETVWTQPTEQRLKQHRHAVAMLKTERAPELAWKPLNLTDPAAWLKPTEHVPGTLRSIAFDPDDETPPPAWLAKGLLPRAGIGLLFGESGSGKSFAAIHASLSVAWGLPLFGAKTKQGAVLYIAAEGGSSVRRRMRAANAELSGALAAANLSRPAGTDPHIRAPITIVTEAPDLSRDGDVKPLLRTIEAAKVEFAKAGHRLALVVIDTWHAAMGGADENSAADAGHALKPLIASSEDGDFLSLIVHHPGKDVEKGARGSNALPAAADAILAVSVSGFTGARAKPAGAPRKVTVTKMRDGDAGREIGYRLRIVPTGVDEDGDPITTCVVEPIDPPKVDAEGLTRSGREFMETVAEAIAEEGGERARLETARLMFYTRRSDAKPDAKRKAWQRALDAALKEGRVATDDHGLMLWLLGGERERS